MLYLYMALHGMIYLADVSLISKTVSQENVKEQYLYLRSSRVLMHSGPGESYPIKWIYHRFMLPIRLSKKGHKWSEVCDIDGDCGWVRNELTTYSKKYAITKYEVIAYSGRNAAISKPKLKISKHTSVIVNSCYNGLCSIFVKGHTAWVEQKSLWGLNYNKNWNSSRMKD